jgi:hypothetical protein
MLLTACCSASPSFPVKRLPLHVDGDELCLCGSRDDPLLFSSPCLISPLIILMHN